MYNLFHQDKLKGRAELYKKYGIRKKVWQSIQFQDFKNSQGELPWLDVKDSREELHSLDSFDKLKNSWQSSLLSWSDQGFAILDQFYSSEQVDHILSLTQQSIDSGKVATRARNKYFNIIHHSKALNDIFSSDRIMGILEMLIGDELRLFQSLSFYKGSQQHAHSDLVHMTTHPLGNLIAIWVALEDIDPDSGPLFYYPGSHRLPFLSTDDFCDNHASRLDPQRHSKYEQKVQFIIEKNNLELKTFLPKKGDVLIWHANLLHGGHPINNPESSRKSIVLHYFAPKAICYHEISHRPALL